MSEVSPFNFVDKECITNEKIQIISDNPINAEPKMLMVNEISTKVENDPKYPRLFQTPAATVQPQSTSGDSTNPPVFYHQAYPTFLESQTENFGSTILKLQNYSQLFSI